MTNLDLDLSQWYNEDDYDYRTPDPLPLDGRSASPAQTNHPQTVRTGLPLLQLADWNPSLPYDEAPPTIRPMISPMTMDVVVTCCPADSAKCREASSDGASQHHGSRLEPGLLDFSMESHKRLKMPCFLLPCVVVPMRDAHHSDHSAGDATVLARYDVTSSNFVGEIDRRYPKDSNRNNSPLSFAASLWLCLVRAG